MWSGGRTSRRNVATERRKADDRDMATDTKKKTLLEQALVGRTPNPGSFLSQEAREEIDLFVAWVDGTIDTADVCRVLGIKWGGSIGAKAGTALRNGVRGSYLKIVKVDQ